MGYLGYLVPQAGSEQLQRWQKLVLPAGSKQLGRWQVLVPQAGSQKHIFICIIYASGLRIRLMVRVSVK